MSLLVRVVIIVLIWQRMKRLLGSILGLTPKVESPINEEAIKFVDLGVLDNDGPLTYRRFAPRTRLADML